MSNSLPVGPAARPPLSGRFLLQIVALLASMSLSSLVLAANPADWWVNIANDRDDKVKTMLAQGADPNELSPKGQPAIMQAIRDGAWKVYDVLVANPKTVFNAMNINRETPLMYLAVVGDTKRAQELIRRGALVNRLGWTPLQYAASKGHVDTVKMLLANKAMVNAPGPDGTTALMMAAYGGDEAVVQVLLNAGADVTMVNLHKWDAAQWARAKKHDALAKKLDALAAKVLAQRAEQRARNKTAGAGADAASPEGSHVETVDLDPPVAADPAKAGDASSPTANSSKPEPSTSKYFDLERFKEDARP